MNYTSTKDLRSGEQKHQEWRTDRQTSGVENR